MAIILAEILLFFVFFFQVLVICMCEKLIKIVQMTYYSKYGQDIHLLNIVFSDSPAAIAIKYQANSTAAAQWQQFLTTMGSSPGNMGHSNNTFV